jgi:hypothetical protein
MDTSYPSPVKDWFASNSYVQVSTAVLVAVISLPFVFVFGLVVLPEGSSLTWFDDLMLFGTACFAALATLLASHRYRGSAAGRAWAFIALGMALMAFGEGAWAFQELALNQDPASPAVADIGYLGFYPAIFIGLFLMPHAPLSGFRRLKMGLDLIIAIGALSLLSFHFVIQDLIDTTNEGTLTDVITIAYPICDLALVFATLALVARAGRSVTGIALGTLALGFIAIAVADSFYAYWGELNDYSSGNFLDTGWVVGYLLITFAALLESGRQLNLDAVPDESAHRPSALWQTTALHGLLIPVGGALFLDLQGSEFRVSIELLIGFVCLVALALTRQILAYFENVRLYNQMEELTVALQDKIRIEKMRKILQSDDRFDVRDRESA